MSEYEAGCSNFLICYRQTRHLQDINCVVWHGLDIWASARDVSKDANVPTMVLMIGLSIRVLWPQYLIEYLFKII